MASDTQAFRLIEYIRSHGLIRPRDLDQVGVDRRVLKRLVDDGRIVRRSRGIYVAPDHEPTRHTDIAEVCIRVPSATVCLLSALDVHELTTQIPHAVWIMIDRTRWRPKFDHPPIHVVYASGTALSTGVNNHDVEGVNVRVTNPAKTVADCFKYRDHVGQDVAIEALRDCLRERKATPSQVYEMAKVDRVTNRILPYIEALT